MFGGLVPFGRRPRDLEQFFERMLQDDFGLGYFSTGIKVDVKENDKNFVVEAEIPGVNKDQIHLDYNNEYLTISVEDNQEIREERENYIRRERRSGRMSRSLYVGNIDEDQISAKYVNGVLTVTLPKTKNAKARKRIDIE
ncbi:Hsp20/alpha crystallin family protein [Thermotalea metallivorans]|uniref:18 kDa heat shock protein n=1 Tax=Thermotalea metallivorans TaxID=520762 RepID=A0A140L4K3_9FIRM|nr:Hsp20/alpha crystallin family protein [Thermotalea metallivorans]KXG75478.1 18 kDa heat shock protein [Thermotalea metallivorans]